MIHAGGVSSALRGTAATQYALRMVSVWVVTTRHFPRKHAHAHLSNFWQETSPYRWTVEAKCMSSVIICVMLYIMNTSERLNTIDRMMDFRTCD
jgi:hypothetical protein